MLENYAYARKSSVKNLGEDVIGSARHKRNERLNLMDAELLGDAELLVTRDSLMKSDPLLFPAITRDNFLKQISCFFTLRAYPAKPAYKKSRYSGSASETRKNYFDIYLSLVKYLENILNDESKTYSIKDISNGARDLLTKKVRTLRAENCYCTLANQFVPIINTSLRENSRKTSVYFKMSQFAKIALEHSIEKQVEAAKSILKGKGISPSFGIKSEKRAIGFKRSDIYLNSSKRRGPELSPMDERQKSSFIMETIGIRSLQWGNYVSDKERTKALTKICEALSDLEEMTGVSLRLFSNADPLALAVGARGSGSALAHFEPALNVINLTKNKGAGSLSHEWAHYIDKMLGKKLGKLNGTYLSDYARKFMLNDEYLKNLRIIDNLKEFRAFSDLVTKRIKKTKEYKECSKKKAEYWISDKEVFARSFETYLFNKLIKLDRFSHYLVGLNPHPFWPTQEEIKPLNSLFDGLLEFIKTELTN